MVRGTQYSRGERAPPANNGVRHKQFSSRLDRLRIRVDREPDESTVLRLARAHRLSVYDASYLELALREAIPVATLDNEVAAAAIAEGTDLIGAIS